MNAKVHNPRWAVMTSSLVLAGFYTGTPVQAQTVPRCELVETLRIGALNGPNALSAISAVLPTRGGTKVFLAQPRDYEIRIVDIAADGTHMRTFGSRGRGPGEFQSISNLSWRVDTLVVADKFQQRLALFNSEGDHLQSLRVVASSPDHPTPAVGISLDPTGSVWGEPVIDMLRVARLDIPGYPIVRLSRNGEYQEVVGLVGLDGSMRVVEYGSGVAIFVQPLSSWHLRAFSPDGQAVVFVDMPKPSGPAGRFDLTKVSFTGDTLYRRSYTYQPRPVTTVARDSIWRAYAVNFARGKTQTAAESIAREQVIIPRTQPPVSHVFIGIGGKVWLRREEISDPQSWIVLDTAGALESVCQAPSGVRIIAADGDHAWGEWKDDLEVPYLVRLAIQQTN